MNQLPLSLAWIATAALALGCGGTVTGSEGGGGGTATGGSGGTTTTTTHVVPPACAVVTDQSAPYQVFFQFTSTSTTPLYLREDCHTNFTITSCEDAYSAPVEIHADCTVDCSQANDCIECGACLEGANPVSQGAPHEVKWAGDTYTFGQNNVGCTCHNASVAPAGKYRITVPVFATEADATANTNPVPHTVDFDLPAPNGIVIVPVDFLPD